MNKMDATATPSEIVGYLVWEHGAKGPAPSKYTKDGYHSSQPEIAADRARRLIRKVDLNGALFDCRLDDLVRFFPLPDTVPPLPPEIKRYIAYGLVDEVWQLAPNHVTHPGQWCIATCNKDRTHALSIPIGHDKPAGIWKDGARVAISIELMPDNPPDSVGMNEPVSAPSAPASPAVVRTEAEIQKAAGITTVEQPGPVYDQSNAD